MVKAAVKQQWLGTVVDEKSCGGRKKRCVLKKGSRREVVLGRGGGSGFIGTVSEGVLWRLWERTFHFTGPNPVIAE